MASRSFLCLILLVVVAGSLPAGEERFSREYRERFLRLLRGVAGEERGDALRPPPAASGRGRPPAARRPRSPTDRTRPARPSSATEEPAGPPVYRIFLDPGHGGKPENYGRMGGAHWDPLQKRFLNVYAYGTEYRAKRRDGGHVFSEQALVLDLAKRIRERLRWTETEEGWERFQSLLYRFGSVLPPYSRVRFVTELSRENDYLTHAEAGARDINKHFRIFDSPAKLPWKPGVPLMKGRLSLASAFSPHLVVSLHIDGSTNPRQRGMSALFVPAPSTFETVRQVILKNESWKVLSRRLRRYWRYSGASRNKLQWMFNDTWTYFTGYRARPHGREPNTESYIGQRWQHVDWAYAKPVEEPPVESLAGPFEGPFFERERSPQEAARREGGPEGIGGDNLYAGRELLRYVRYALWKEYLEGGSSFTGKTRAEQPLSPRQYLPPHEKPTGSDWAMPLYTNAVAPYLELGQLYNSEDRYLLTRKLDALADGLAVGIYSLVVGHKVTEFPGVESPRGAPIDWSRYQMRGGSTWFEASHPRHREVQSEAE